MGKIQRILYPTDFSEIQDKVWPYVEEMVDKHRASLHVVYVVEDVHGRASLFRPLPAKLEEMYREEGSEAERRLKQWRETHPSEALEVHTKVLYGDPAWDIVKYAQEVGANLIVMGTHGRKGLRHAVLGSVAENVIRNSATPVLTVNPHRA